MIKPVFLLVGVLVADAAIAQIPQILPAANCIRSQSILSCHTPRGDQYSVARRGNLITIRGYETTSREHWTQSVVQYGRFTLLGGVTSRGRVWLGSSRRIGWNEMTRVSTSSGDHGRVICNRLVGCQLGK